MKTLKEKWQDAEADYDWCWYCGWQHWSHAARCHWRHPDEPCGRPHYEIDLWLDGNELADTLYDDLSGVVPCPAIEWPGFLDVFLSTLPDAGEPAAHTLESLVDWIADREHDRAINLAIMRGH